MSAPAAPQEYHAVLRHPLDAALDTCGNQRWHYDAKSGHITGFDGRVLDVNAGTKAPGTAVIYFNRAPYNTPNQQWDYTSEGYLMSRMGTGLCIDVSGSVANVKDGGELVMSPPTNGADQKWDIDEFGFIRSRHNPKFCIAVSGGAKPATGLSKVTVWTAALSTADTALAYRLRKCQHQRFHYDPASGYVTGFDGRVLDVSGADTKKGAPLIFYDKEKGPGVTPDKNQAWDYRDGALVTRMSTGFVIDVSGGPESVKDGGELILFKNESATNQLWEIDEFGFIRSKANRKFCIEVVGGPIPGKGLTKLQVKTCAI